MQSIQIPLSTQKIHPSGAGSSQERIKTKDSLIGILHVFGCKEEIERYERYEPLSSPMPVVIVAHGFLSTMNSPTVQSILSALSHEFERKLSKGGKGNPKILGVFVFDFEGNGQSNGMWRFSPYLRDVSNLRTVVNYFRAPERASFFRVVSLVGHSQAANDVILYASKYDGDVPIVVAVAPRYEMSKGWQQYFTKDQIETILATKKNFDTDAIIEDWKMPNAKKSTKGRTVYVADVNRRMALDMRSVAANIQQTQVIVIHGTQDEVIPFQGSVDMYAQSLHNMNKLTRSSGGKFLLNNPHQLVAIPLGNHTFFSSTTTSSGGGKLTPKETKQLTVQALFKQIIAKIVVNRILAPTKAKL
mmetsp:Transcript_20743/g.30863  ORF Transcript_20743/g.30863 Transcript_20743/m.30863 type:complete len:359 (+) Transcript_20743:78-1154(+)